MASLASVESSMNGRMGEKKTWPKRTKMLENPEKMVVSFFWFGDSDANSLNDSLLTNKNPVKMVI